MLIEDLANMTQAEVDREVQRLEEVDRQVQMLEEAPRYSFLLRYLLAFVLSGSKFQAMTRKGYNV